MKIEIYTDGSCLKNPGPGGWGSVFNFNGIIKILKGGENNVTNNRMELMAVLKSLEKIISLDNKENNNFVLHSDSAYVVNAINSCWIQKWKMNGWKTAKGDPVKNKELWLELYSALNEINKKKINFKIIKVKAHVGIKFNELVDSIAKEQANIIKDSLEEEQWY